MVRETRLSRLSSRLSELFFCFAFISVDLLRGCIDNLKLHKAAGHDGITVEHIVYGGNDLVVHVCLLFNSMLRHSFVPSDFRFGLIRPVLKDKHGDITSTDMYRPITITPVMSKLFELVLLQLYGDFLTSDNLQFGFKKETGCSHALMLSYRICQTFC